MSKSSNVLTAPSSLRPGSLILLSPRRSGLPSARPKNQTSVPRQVVFEVTQLPEWMQLDPYIVRGYRPELRNFVRCLWSLFYFHNESINIWSHLLPGFYFLALLLLVEDWVVQLPLDAAIPDILALQTYVAGTTGCLVFSAVFHATSAHSHEVATAFLKLDYLGIVMTISTTCISVTYFGLHDSPSLRTPYILFTVTCAFLVFWTALDPCMDGTHAGPWRAGVFILLAASGLAPIAHILFSEGTVGLVRFPLQSLSVKCLSYAVGTAVYVSRFPEKYWPRKFDLLGASHQIFHVLIAFGQIVHLHGLRAIIIRLSLNER